MDSLEQIFFELLRSAMWNTTPQLKCEVTESEWSDIYSLSKEQAVLGIMLDSISRLPQTNRPPKKLLLQWIVVQKGIEKSNIAINRVLEEIYNGLENKGIDTYVMKGQGVAQNYPIPSHRACGDIDLYFKQEQLKDSIDYFKSIGCKIEDTGQYSHVETTYKGIKIELHKKSATLYSKKILNRYERILAETLRNEEACYVKVEDYNVRVLPPNADAMQLLAHMLRHIMISGLGIRQVCDWVLFMNKNHNRIDKKKFLAYLEETQLIGAYRAISLLSVDYLGMPEELVFCKTGNKDKRIAKKMLNIIMRYGNFGHYGEHNNIRNKWEYLKSYIWKIRNCMRFYSIASSEAVSFPLWQLHSLKKVFKK